MQSLNEILDKKVPVLSAFLEDAVKEEIKEAFKEWLQQKQHDLEEQIKLHFKKTPIELLHRQLYLKELLEELNNP